VKKAVQTTEVEAWNPTHRFADFEMHSKLKANVAKAGYVHPTPIQDGAIPHILEGKDVIGIANTGTGKTAAFLLPLIHKTFKYPTEKVLIIIPTRELALQIEEELRKFSDGSGLRSALCIGGSHMGDQIRSLSRNPSFVIGTPGRLKDLVERGKLHLTEFNNVVLDEVDRMLDMGFINDIKYLVALLKTPRQSLFFSATMPREIAELTKKFSNNAVTITIKSRATSENVDQDVVRVLPKEDKIEVLHNLLLKPEFTKVLISAVPNTVWRNWRCDSKNAVSNQIPFTVTNHSLNVSGLCAVSNKMRSSFLSQPMWLLEGLIFQMSHTSSTTNYRKITKITSTASDEPAAVTRRVPH